MDKLVLSTRQDGLGTRLLTMSFAKLVADRLGCRFGFTWNAGAVVDLKTHFVGTVGQIFDRDFIDRYWVGEDIDSRGFGRLSEDKFTIEALAAEIGREESRGWICEPDAYRNIMPRDQQVLADHSKAFHEIVFTPRLREIMDRARAAPLAQDVVALHLRAGDIVYGSFRNRPHFVPKAIPAPLAPSFIARLQERGSEVLLFGQDPERLLQLRSRTGCRLAEDFGAPPRDVFTERDFFEFTLMSRCREIYGGTSSFNVLASILNLTPILDPARLSTPAEMQAALLEELRRNGASYNDLETAFSYFFAACMTCAAGSKEQAALLESGYRLDPDNRFYPMKLAAIAFADGRLDDGEDILALALGTRGRKDRERVYRTLKVFRRYDAKLDWEDDIKSFAAAAEAGRPHAAACYAAYLACNGDSAGAARWADIALRIDPRNFVFRKIARTIPGNEAAWRRMHRRLKALSRLLRGRKPEA